jgi:hypothetical protein
MLLHYRDARVLRDSGQAFVVHVAGLLETRDVPR